MNITNYVRWIGTKVCDPPKFDGTNLITNFLEQMEEAMPEYQQL